MHNLPPLHLTPSEPQDSLAQEYQREATLLKNLKLPQKPSGHGSSGSDWSKVEVNAVRAVPLLNQNPSRIIPEHYFPNGGDQGFTELAKSICAPSIDDLKGYNEDLFERNPYCSFFVGLSELATTGTSEDTINKQFLKSTSMGSMSSELSTSSNEDSSESVAATALRNFVVTTLIGMKQHKNLANTASKRVQLRCSANEVRFTWKMGGSTYVAENDGLIGVNFPGSMSGSDRNTKAPVVNLECKQRNAGGIKRRSGEPEGWNPSIFAQEVAEMIGSMQTQMERNSFCLPDQESFVISLHGTLFYVSTAYFSPEYISYLKDGESPPMPDFLWVRRSTHYDLKDRAGRKGALEILWALVRYIASGEAKVNIVHAAMKALGRPSD
ncbi:hypothetical protein BDW42DRAFT_187030 [Aspergillus taichungensis]|uniref:Uncharacterized protein n=1 Tax=Aspergillus taichungensis TaxID=482145 RepID=A0A2J5HP57_9EURO|nr:hypothetical protein BDW42DRAFT_187030 [Aspergillus taichungensis]